MDQEKNLSKPSDVVISDKIKEEIREILDMPDLIMVAWEDTVGGNDLSPELNKLVIGYLKSLMEDGE